LFSKILERQLVLKGVITLDDWSEFRNVFKYEYSEDNHFAELKNTEVLRDRVSMLRDVDDYVGKYFSNEWVRRNVLYQSEEDMEEIDKQIKEEENIPQYNPQVGPDGQPIDTGPSPASTSPKPAAAKPKPAQ
jgi:hypothetical protein